MEICSLFPFVHTELTNKVAHKQAPKCVCSGYTRLTSRRVTFQIDKVFTNSLKCRSQHIEPVDCRGVLERRTPIGELQAIVLTSSLVKGNRGHKLVVLEAQHPIERSDQLQRKKGQNFQMKFVVEKESKF